MDLTTPIDIQAVIGAVKEHRDLLTTLDAEQAAEYRADVEDFIQLIK